MIRTLIIASVITAAGWLYLHHGVAEQRSDYRATGTERETLCENGHPRHRLPDCAVGIYNPGVCISYGGLHRCRGYQRDHITPLGLGGPDELSNLQYQPLDEARRKDHEMEDPAIEEFCSGRISREEAVSRFRRTYPEPKPGQCPL